MVTDELARARWSEGGEIRVSVMPSFRACGARPSATRPTATRVALRGRPWDNAESGFLGGTHSVRPRCEASPMPRHNMIIGGKRTPGGLMGRFPGRGKTPLASVRSPPLVSYA